VTVDTSSPHYPAALEPRPSTEQLSYRRQHHRTATLNRVGDGVDRVMEPVDRVGDAIELAWHLGLVFVAFAAVGTAAVVVNDAFGFGNYVATGLSTLVCYVAWVLAGPVRIWRPRRAGRPGHRQARREPVSAVPPVVIMVSFAGVLLAPLSEPVRLLVASCIGVPIALVFVLVGRLLSRAVDRTASVAVETGASAIGSGVAVARPHVKRSFARAGRTRVGAAIKEGLDPEVPGFVTPALVGSPGTVRQSIPPGGYGRAEVLVRGGTHLCHAAARQVIPAGTLVIVTAALGPDAVEVMVD
jgi:hypothetical protein